MSRKGSSAHRTRLTEVDLTNLKDSMFEAQKRSDLPKYMTDGQRKTKLNRRRMAKKSRGHNKRAGK